MNMFKPTAAKTPTEYLEMIADPTRRAEVKQLHKQISGWLPKLKPQILSGMIGYGLHHFVYPSGRNVDWSIVALASQKNYISVYICASDGKQYVAEKYKELFPKASIGKSCIRFKKAADIDMKALGKVILEGVDLVTNNYSK